MPTLLEYVSQQALVSLNSALSPELAAWCSWGKILEYEEGRSAESSTGHVIGSLVGGTLGGEIGRALGGAAGMAVRGAPVGEGSVYTASFGAVLLSAGHVVVVDCGSTGSITSSGIRPEHIEKMVEDMQSGQMRLIFYHGLRDKVQASLRHDGTVLQLRGVGTEVWQLQVAKFKGQPEAPDFVRAIMKVPDLPPLDEFVLRTQATPPDAAMLDAMVADGAYVDQVLRRLSGLPFETLSGILGNLSASASSGFAVLLESWLAERAEPSQRLTLAWQGTAAAGLLCAGFVIALSVRPPTGDSFPLIAALIGGAVALIASGAFFFQASKAKWFAGQLERFREARSRKS